MDDIQRAEQHERTIPVVTHAPAGASVKKARKRRIRLPKLRSVILLLLLVALIAVSAFLYLKYQETQKQVEKLSTIQGQQELNKTQVNQLLGEMRSIIVLPKGEDPVVATIVDIKQLKDKEFYKDAKNGDRVVVFSNAKKAYIYRPETKTIVNVGAFQVDNSQTPQTTTQSPVSR